MKGQRDDEHSDHSSRTLRTCRLNALQLVGRLLVLEWARMYEMAVINLIGVDCGARTLFLSGARNTI